MVKAGKAYDIIVPSKGRADPSLAPTMHQLEKAKVEYTIVVEKEDLNHYSASFPNASFWVLPASNRGIGYSRNYILQRASRPFVMVDDDVYSTFRRVTTMKKITLLKFLDDGWKIFTKLLSQHPTLAVFGFKHGTFAIPKVATTLNTTIAHCVFVNAPLLHRANVHYDEKLRAFEDIDIIFKCIQNGLMVARNNHLVYLTTPSGMSVVGGIDYHNDLKHKQLSKMIKRYPGWIESDHRIREKDGQPVYHINWGRI